MHIMEPLIQRVRALKLADFAENGEGAEDEEGAEYQAHDGHIHPDLNPDPPMLLVSIVHHFPFRSDFKSILQSPSHRMFATQEDVEDRRPVDAMDTDKDPSDVEEVPEDESEEAPSERDTDVESKGESPQTSHNSDDDEPICQTPLEEPMSTPGDPSVSALRARTLDFATPSQSRGRINTDEGEDDADEHRVGNDDDRTDEEVREDQDDDDQHDEEHEDQDVEAEVDVVSESSHSDCETRDLPQPVPRSPPRPTTSDVVPRGAMDTPKRTNRTRSRASKDKHKRRHVAPVEPAITESLLEEKMLGLLGRTLPGLLSSLLKDVMAQAVPTPIPTPAPVPAVVEVDSTPLPSAAPQEQLPEEDDQCGSPKCDQPSHVDQPEPAKDSADKDQVQQKSPADDVMVEGPTNVSQPADDEVNIEYPIFASPMVFMLCSH